MTLLSSQVLASAIFLLFLSLWSHGQPASENLVTIAFYNVENLFDSEDDPQTLDDDFTITGKNHYSQKAYRNKLSNIARVISLIGKQHTGSPPSLLGLAEIENRKVLEELVESDEIRDANYRIIHFDSPDIRGIDVALLYRESQFTPLEHEALEVKIWDERGQRLYTRDILWVYGFLLGEEVHLLINHWPSRRRGAAASAPKRLRAAYQARTTIDGILNESPEASILVLGDFNDNPSDKSIESGLLATANRKRMHPKEMFNPMQGMYARGWNSMAFRGELHLFDQILMSWSLACSKAPQNGLRFSKAGIFNPLFLIQSSGPYLGYPFRSFQNGYFSGGFSDHYPVYVLLKKMP